MPAENNRGAGAEDTAEKILQAARVVLARGSHRFGLEEVARQAGITRRTIYHHFSSRLALLEAVVVDFEVRAGVYGGLDAFQLEDPSARVAAIAREACTLWASDQAVIRAIFGLAFDPPVRQMLDAHDAGRRRMLADQVTMLARAGVLCPGLDSDGALAALMLLTGFEAFDHLVSKDGLSTENASATLAELAAGIVVEPAP
jgi:AcrR family transcriptional regulator